MHVTYPQIVKKNCVCVCVYRMKEEEGRDTDTKLIG